MRRKVHVAFGMLMLDSKPYFYVDYMIPLLKRVSNWCLLDCFLSQSEDHASDPMRACNSTKGFENQPWALYILKAKSFCFDFRVVLAALDQTNPNPTMIWNNFISLYWNFFEFFDCSICSRQTVLCSGANSRFSYTDSEYNYGATKIIFPIINQKI